LGTGGIKKTKEDIDQAREHIEECIEDCIHSVENQSDPIKSHCKKIGEDAKRLQNSSSSYDRGLSKATSGDLVGAEAEFNTAIEQQLPVLSKYYFNEAI